MSIPPKFAKSHQLLQSVAGTNPVNIDLYLDFLCPWCNKIYLKWFDELIPLLNEKYPGKFQLIFRQVVQPWHAASQYMHETALAVAYLAPEKFGKFAYDLYVEQKRWFNTPTYEKTRKQLYEELSQFAAEKTGLDQEEIFSYLKVDESTVKGDNKLTLDIKQLTRFQRQNGAHVTPTTAINGVFVNNIESGTSIEDVVKVLESYL